MANINWIILARKQREPAKIQGGPKKVSHYRESSLNRIKNRQPG